MTDRPKTGRLRVAAELLAVAAVVLGLSLYALWKMDYLSDSTAHYIRMTDSTRTAYVAKNIATGRGYTTDELPTYAVEFYDQQGKLHQSDWVNSDRFPFTAYAVAALYTVTGSTSETTGILIYNLLWFLALMVGLYWFARTVWADRWSPVLCVVVALFHPLTFNYLYAKDADMLTLVLGTMWCAYRYFQRGPTWLTWWRVLVMGTILGWLYLARPNIGLGFIAFLGLAALLRVWRARSGGWRPALLSLARHELAVLGVIIAWCIPFVIHSMAQWGEPFFSANALYQQPLGTRFAMNTDTWWKYAEPGRATDLGTLMRDAGDQVMSKFPTSWVATLKGTIPTWPIETLLTFGLIARLRRRPAEADPALGTAESRVAVRRIGAMVFAAVLINFLVLPLYGYQGTTFRYYLSFFLPMLWLCAGKALALLLAYLRPGFEAIRDHVKRRPAVWALVAIAVYLLWMSQSGAGESLISPYRLVAKHWLTAGIVMLCVLFPPILFGRHRTARILIVIVIVLVGRYRPYLSLKVGNLYWYPADRAVWSTLRERKGLVSSLAVQSEVNWVSGRRNLPVPENPLHIYSFLYDHRLEVEDVYIESAEAMLARGGPLVPWAPGFEAYARMQRLHATLPGYAMAFDASQMKGYPKYKLAPIKKASSVWRLTDREVVRAVGESPEVLALGTLGAVAFETHGWGELVIIDGKPAAAATDNTIRRYSGRTEKPYEDTSVSFFIGARTPRAIELEIYSTQATTLELFWNLDLYAYDRAGDRASHSLGSFTVTADGWQRIKVDVPARLVRHGFNKLGWRSSAYQPVVVCPQSASVDLCGGIQVVTDDALDRRVAPDRILHFDGPASPTAFHVSVFAGSLEFKY